MKPKCCTGQDSTEIISFLDIFDANFFEPKVLPIKKLPIKVPLLFLNNLIS